MRSLRALLACLAASGCLSSWGSYTSDAGVPFVTTPDGVTLAMLELAQVGPQDYVIDLGSGDGRIVILAAKRFGARGLGVEIVPELVKLSNENARKAGVAERARFLEQDLYLTDLSPATVITMYLLPEVNMYLRDALLRLEPGTRIVSHDWDMGSWKPDASIVVPAPEKKVGLEKTSKVLMWVVPAPVEGAWCAPDARVVTLTRNFQSVVGSLAGARYVLAFEGRISGNALFATRGSNGSLGLALDSGRLRVTSAEGAFAALRGATLSARIGPTCPSR
jgi:SAM-dependent methyltransferase